MVEDPLNQVFFNASAQNAQNSSHHIERVSAEIEIYTVPFQQLGGELKKLLTEQDNSSYLQDNPEATCTIYQISKDQVQITISPNGDGLGLDLEATNQPICENNSDFISCCISWLSEYNTDCLTLRNNNGQYIAFREDC